MHEGPGRKTKKGKGRKKNQTEEKNHLFSSTSAIESISSLSSLVEPDRAHGVDKPRRRQHQRDREQERGGDDDLGKGDAAPPRQLRKVLSAPSPGVVARGRALREVEALVALPEEAPVHLPGHALRFLVEAAGPLRRGEAARGERGARGAAGAEDGAAEAAAEGGRVNSCSVVAGAPAKGRGRGRPAGTKRRDGSSSCCCSCRGGSGSGSRRRRRRRSLFVVVRKLGGGDEVLERVSLAPELQAVALQEALDLGRAFVKGLDGLCFFFFFFFFLFKEFEKGGKEIRRKKDG